MAFWVTSLIIVLICFAGLAAAEDMTGRIIYPEYWYQQGVSEFLLKHYDRALTLLDTAIAQDPDLADAWYWRGVVLSALGDSKGSVESINKAKAMNPMIDDPYHRRVGPLADLEIKPVPTQRVIKEEQQPQMVQTNIDLSKKPDPTGPDIVITSFTPRVREGNPQLEIKATVENQGYRPTTDFFITFYASKDKTITRDDTPIGYYLIQNLKTGEVKHLTGYFPMERMEPGDFYIGAIADPGNEIMEVSEDNNVAVYPTKITIPDVKSSAFLVTTGSVPFVSEEIEKDTRFAVKRPDLVVSKVTAGQSGVQGGTLTVSTIVKNQGSAAAGAFKISVYLSRDGRITEQDREIGYGVVSDLGPGLLREGEAVVTIPPDLLPGDYYLGVMVDSEKVIAEENEANNILFADKKVKISASKGPGPSPSPAPTKVPSVQELADLVVMEVSSDTTGTPGGVMNVTTSIRNVGTVDAGPFVVELYLSADQNLSDEDILLGMGRIPELPAGTQSDGNAPTPIPADIAPGTYYFGILVDAENDVAESDKSNNVMFAKIPVTIK